MYTVLLRKRLFPITREQISNTKQEINSISERKFLITQEHASQETIPSHIWNPSRSAAKIYSSR